MSGEFAVKIKDIITEVFSITKNNKPIVGPGAGQTWSKIGRGLKFGASIIKPPASIPPSQQIAQNQAQQDAVEPDTSTSKLGPNWKDTTLGISIKPATQTSPAMAYYQKKYYVLTNFGKWLTANNRPVPDTTAVILNQALEQT